MKKGCMLGKGCRAFKIKCETHAHTRAHMHPLWIMQNPLGFWRLHCIHNTCKSAAKRSLMHGCETKVDNWPYHFLLNRDIKLLLRPPGHQANFAIRFSMDLSMLPTVLCSSQKAAIKMMGRRRPLLFCRSVCFQLPRSPRKPPWQSGESNLAWHCAPPHWSMTMLFRTRSKPWRSQDTLRHYAGAWSLLLASVIASFAPFVRYYCNIIYMKFDDAKTCTFPRKTLL